MRSEESELNFNLSLFDKKRDTQPQAVKRTWAQICERLSRPVVRLNKDGPLFSPATFNPPYRRSENVIELSVLVLDCDHQTIFEGLRESLRALGCAFAIYSTHSHCRATAQNPNAEPRFRVVIPLAWPIPAAEFHRLWRWAIAIRGVVVDIQAKDLARMFYTPVKATEDAPYEFHVEPGAFLDWRALDLPESTLSRDNVAQAGNAPVSGPPRTIFTYEEERNEELCRRIAARGRLNLRGNYDARCLAHNGRGTTSLVYFPNTKFVHCTAGCDRDAILVAEGLTTGYLPSRAEPWELPIGFCEYNLPSFPVKSLPDWLCSFVKELARETQTPVDLPAMLVLTVCAGSAAGKVRVQARKGWVEPLNLYTVTAMNPANRKSAVFAAICEPLEEVERALLEAKRDEIAQAASEIRILEERCKIAEKESAKTEDAVERKGKKEEAIRLAQELASLKVPAVPRLIASDATPEALASLLAEQGGRISLFSSEGDLFDMLAGRYTGGAPNFDVVLKGHSGDVLRVDRRTRSEHVRHPALTIGLTVQPEVIRGLVDKKGFRGRGLIGRFLYCLAVSTIGNRQINAEPVAGAIRHVYKKNVKALAELEAIQDSNGSPVPRMLYLSSEANGLLENFERDLEPRLGEEGDLGMMSDWAGKLAGAIVRIVGLLHLAEHVHMLAPWPERIGYETMRRAIAIGRYLIPHAQAAYAEMGADQQTENAKHLLRWIRKSGHSSFTKRDAHQAHKGRLGKVPEIEPALELLEAHQYIRPILGEMNRRPGRKGSQVFGVNPKLFSTSQNPHNPQNSTRRGNSEDSENCENENAQPESSTSVVQPSSPVARERLRI